MKVDPPRAETEHYWRSMWKHEAPWLSALRAEQSHLPKQESVLSMVKETQYRVDRDAELAPDMIHT